MNGTPFIDFEPSVVPNEPWLIIHPTLAQPMKMDLFTAKEVYQVLKAYLEHDLLIDRCSWNGLVTMECDGHEVIYGWFENATTAQYVAQKLIKNKKTTGSRAYATLGEYGIYATERPIISDDEELADCCQEEPAEEEPAEGTPQVTMDRWFS